MACELCGRETRTTFHHLIPRMMHRKRRFLRRFTKEQMQRSGLNVCRLCHTAIHDLIPSEKELGDSYYTRELLLAHSAIQRHVEWAARQKC